MLWVAAYAISCRSWWKEEAVLFITNGDSAAGKIGASGLAGEILPWRDVLHEGPVPGGLSPEGLADVRARFLAERGWTDLAGARRDFAQRDATLASYGDHEEIVLFFEHDLYDQLQLIQVLDWFSERDLEAIAGGSSTPGEAFAAHHEREEHLFLSDAVFASYLKDLGDARQPLILLEGDVPVPGRRRSRAIDRDRTLARGRSPERRNPMALGPIHANPEAHRRLIVFANAPITNPRV
jgi:hypothetical protein